VVRLEGQKLLGFPLSRGPRTLPHRVNRFAGTAASASAASAGAAGAAGAASASARVVAGLMR